MQDDGEYITNLVFSPDGKFLASSDREGMVAIWDVAGAKRRATHEARDWDYRIGCLAFSPDGKTLAAGTPDPAVKLWDVTTGEERATLRPDVGSVRALAFSPDGKSLVVGGGKETRGYNQPPQYLKCDVKLWDVPAGKETASWAGHPRLVACLAVSPDGLTVASGAEDGTVRLWDVATGKERANLSGPAGGTWCLAFSSDGHLIAGAGADRYHERLGGVSVWDVTTGKKLAGFTDLPYAVRAVVFSPDGKTVISADSGRTVKRWEVPDPNRADK
jgi:WD40 repeat protein